MFPRGIVFLAGARWLRDFAGFDSRGSYGTVDLKGLVPVLETWSACLAASIVAQADAERISRRSLS